MSAHKRLPESQNAHLLMLLLIIAGVFGLLVQALMPDAEMLAFMTGLAAVGGLVGASRQFDEREQQLLSQAFSAAFQWSLFALLVVSAFYSVLAWLHFTSGLAVFMSEHWTGLMVSAMCLLLGIAGYRTFRET